MAEGLLVLLGADSLSGSAAGRQWGLTGNRVRFLIDEDIRNIAICDKLCRVHVISEKALETFWLRHSTARTPLEAWYRIAGTSSFETFAEVTQAFNTADYVAPYIVFDVGGNNFRVITVVHFNRQKLYIRNVLTHAEYDKWNKANRSKRS